MIYGGTGPTHDHSFARGDMTHQCYDKPVGGFGDMPPRKTILKSKTPPTGSKIRVDMEAL